MRNEASFAALCGASPIEASSGHRAPPPQPGGNRQANNALWRIAITRLRVDQRTIDSPNADAPTAKPAARSSAASNATSHARSTGSSPTRPKPPTAPTCAEPANAPDSRDTGALNVPLTRIELERGLRHNNDLAKRYQQHLAQLPT